MNYHFTFLPFFSLLLLLLSCDNEESDLLIDPADADALSRVLAMPDGADRRPGDLPQPTNTTTAPTASSRITDLQSSNGSTTPLVFDYANTDDDLAGCYVQVDGAGDYFIVPYAQSAGNSGQLSLPIGIPTNVDEGTFDVIFSVFNQNGEASQPIYTTINVLRLGTGSLQISMSWDNTTDQDLHVTDPNGETIFYLERTSVSGGQLDRDDLDGYGPENIFWTDDAPDGDYTIVVNQYSGRADTNFYITVSGAGGGQTFSGSNSVVSPRSMVTTFTKDGNRLIF